MRCEPCGMTYAQLRTGLTFAAVKQLMYVGPDDPGAWRSKSRRAVLGYWHELKLQLWSMHVGLCEAANDNRGGS